MHNFEKKMEMDGPYNEKRGWQHRKDCLALDIRRKDENRKTQNNTEKNSGERKVKEWGVTWKTENACTRQTGMEILRCCPTCQTA